MADDGRSDQVQQRSVVKKGIDSNDTRRRKADNTLTIRKNKRLENQQKRRQSAAPPPLGGGGNDEDPGPPLPPTSRFDPDSAFVTYARDNAVIYDKKQEVIYEPDEMPKVISAINSSDRRLRITATAHLRKLLSIEINPPISQVTRMPNVVLRLVEFLSFDDDPALQFEAAWALTNIASGTPEQTRTVINHDAIPKFVRLLSSPNDDVREQSVWALGNIAGDGAKCRDKVLDAGVRDPLIRCVYSAKRLTMLRNATWTISNLSRGKPAPAFAKVKPFLSVLSRLVFSVDDEVLTDACWALSYLSEGSNEKIQALIDSGVCRRLVELLMHVHVGVVTPALRTIGNVVTGDDMQTQVVVDAHAIPALVEALWSKKKGIKKEACWTLSNITAGDRLQIQRVIEANAIKPLVHLLKTGEFDIKKEAAWALSNACSGGTERQIHEVASQGFIPPLIDLLSIHDPRMTVVGLDALDHILDAGRIQARRNNSANPYVAQIEKCGGVAKLEQLLNSMHDDLYKKAHDLLQKYFNRSATAEDVAVAPAKGDDGFEFNADGDGDGDFNFSDQSNSDFDDDDVAWHQ